MAERDGKTLLPGQRFPESDDVIRVTLTGTEWARVTAALQLIGQKPGFYDYELARVKVYDQVVDPANLVNPGA